MISTVGVVGAGTMGSGIAQVFAQAGIHVRLYDKVPAALDGARAGIDKSLSKFVEKGAIAPAQKDAALGRIRACHALEDLAAAEYVVEAASEDLELKMAIFRDLDEVVAPGVVLSSNTSSISITTLGVATRRPSYVVGMHFMNPVPLMPLVEIIRGQSTSDQALATAFDLCRRLGKTGVEARDAPGFIANRILMPMINEAIYAFAEGVGTADAIDTVMKLGMNHPMGPLALADLIGLDVCLAIMDVLREGFDDEKYAACPLLVRMVAEGQLGRKTGRGFYTY